MKVIIKSPPQTLPILKKKIFETNNISMDSEKRYAVAEIFKNKMYVALKINNINDNTLVGEYVDKFEYCDDVTYLINFSVNWGCIQYGFCKLNMWAPELANEHDGYFDHTAKRFYFDWELYKKCYEEINGVPCEKKKPNE